jgi:hypothetical protein
MKFKIEMKGLERVKSRVKAVPSAIEAELRKEIFEAAQEVQREAIKAIEAPKSGRLYRKRVRGILQVWRASAPGEAPAKRTGKNLALISVQKANRKDKPASRIRAPKIYKLLAKGLAIGKGRQVLPRPLFGPLSQKFRNKFRDRVEAAAAKVMKVTIRRK